MYIAKSENTKQYRIYYRYAEAIYKWLNNNYSEKEEDLRKRLSENVATLFDNMYAGKRVVSIDDRYNISMRTVDGDVVDLTGGLRVIQYFAYVGGLVQLAYDVMCERKEADDEEASFSGLGEQYPLVLDAAFSHADENHTKNIAKELSEATHQLVFAIMKKDWKYAESGLVGKVGRMYELVKIDETEVKINAIGGAE